MSQKKIYADQWEKSSSFFYENDDYKWMAKYLHDYKIILEVGSGTGYSTLELLEYNHKIISVDNNKYCLEHATERLTNAGYRTSSSIADLDNVDVVLLEGDVTEETFFNQVKNMDIDVVICWNVGSYWDNEMISRYFPKFITYGLTVDQIRSNPESSYAELIVWSTMNIASEMKKPVHLIERLGQELTPNDIHYYNLLKNKFNYSDLSYDQKFTKSISDGGRVMTVNGVVNHDSHIDVHLTSLLYK